MYVVHIFPFLYTVITLCCWLSYVRGAYFISEKKGLSKRAQYVRDAYIPFFTYSKGICVVGSHMYVVHISQVSKKG